MSKHRSTLTASNPDLGDYGAKPASGVKVQPFHEQPAALTNERPSGVKERAVNMTAYLMPSDHKRLKQLALDSEVSIQTLLLDGIDHLFAKAGQEPVTRWEPRRKKR